jgi:ADP-ribosylation factor-like protein 2
MYIIII